MELECRFLAGSKEYVFVIYFPVGTSNLFVAFLDRPLRDRTIRFATDQTCSS